MSETATSMVAFDDRDALAAALADWSAALGADAVVTDPGEVSEFRDPYTPASWNAFVPSAVLMPASVEEVQAIVRIANANRVPIWVVSQGRNNGYGGGAPRMSGTVVVSLRRMNRVLEINEELAYVVVEPGVSFFELYEAVRESGKKLWIDVPDLGWGSVIGNTTEHGYGYTVYGDHAAAQCGMEVVLPDGEVVRTGLGGMPGNPSWHLSKRGFGPSTDGLFMQSNMGIVTKMGMWVMPQPEAYLDGWIKVPNDSDLEPLIDALRPLMIDGTISQYPMMFNAMAVLGLAATRADVWPNEPPLPAAVAEQIVADTAGLRPWNLRFALYGDSEIVSRNFALVEAALAHIPGVEVTGRHVDPETVADNPDLDQKGKVHAGVPDLSMLKALEWDGGERGGHVLISSTTPLTGRDARAIVDLVRDGVEARDFEYGVGIVLNPRFLVHICLIAYDLANEEKARQAYSVCQEMIGAAGQLGYGEYRAHLDYMDLVAEQFSFNGGSHMSLVETIKDALDPNGILAPGKQGIWPRHLRTR